MICAQAVWGCLKRHAPSRNKTKGIFSKNSWLKLSHLQKFMKPKWISHSCLLISRAYHNTTTSVLCSSPSASNLSDHRLDCRRDVSLAWHTTWCRTSRSQPHLMNSDYEIWFTRFTIALSSHAAWHSLSERSIHNNIYRTRESDVPLAGFSHCPAWLFGKRAKTGSMWERWVCSCVPQHNPLLGSKNSAAGAEDVPYYWLFLVKTRTESQGKAQYCNPQGMHGTATQLISHSRKSQDFSKGFFFFFVSLLTIQISREFDQKPKNNPVHV